MECNALGSTPRGELLLRGPCPFSGYYKAPSKTAAAMDPDGFFRTGGYWVVAGRGHQGGHEGSVRGHCAVGSTSGDMTSLPVNPPPCCSAFTGDIVELEPSRGP